MYLEHGDIELILRQVLPEHAVQLANLLAIQRAAVVLRTKPVTQKLRSMQCA